ncbi:MAG: outer membrane beta-barrel protein [bacterium]
MKNLSHFIACDKLLSMLVPFVTLMLVLPTDVSAQGRFSLDAHGGGAVSAGELSAFTEVGPAFGLGIAYWFRPRVAVRIDLDTSLLSSKDSGGTSPNGSDANLLHINVGLQFNLTKPEATPWSVAVIAGGGASALEVVDGQGVFADFDETYFTLNGGLRLGYVVSRNFSIFVDGRLYLTFTDEKDTSVIGQFAGVDPDGFSTASDIPVTVGIRFKTN